jgi:subtilisin family serine protease
MLEEVRNRLISEEYADLLIVYSGDMSVFDAFPDGTVHILNYLYAVVNVPVSRINENIIAELGYSVMPTCYGIISQESLEASGIIRLRNIPNFNLRGQGVLLGIVDTGIDYTNPIFQYADGTTRIEAIWDQTIQSEIIPESLGYGSVFTKEQINEALKSENPLELVPVTDPIGHGTMVAGIAGGNEVPESNFYGVAPDSEFIVVKLKQAKRYLRDFFFIPEDAPCYQENDIVAGIDYLLSESIRLNKPIVIFLAIGSSQGGHDGKGALSNIISINASRQGTAILVAAGNEGNERHHYFGMIDTTTGVDTVELNVGENVRGFSMELWGQTPSLFSVDILTPTGEYVPRVAVNRNTNRVITFIFEQTVIYLDYQIVESESGDLLILFRFDRPTPGIWRFNVYGRGDFNPSFHIWLPMKGFIPDNTYFIRSDPYTTVLSAGNADAPLTITAYNVVDNSLYLNASRGFSRLGVITPELAAPGVNITGPDTTQGFASFTGTSSAVAFAAGVSALVLEWGVIRNNLPDMSTVELKKLFIRGARRDPNLLYPNRDWGYGILDLYNLFDALRTGLMV